MTDFRSNPVRSKVDALLRPALHELCKHYQLQASSRMRKREVKEILFQYYVDEGILDEGVLDDFNVGLTSDALKEIELAKIPLETQKAKLDHELALKRVAAGTDVPRLPNASRKFDTIKHVRMVPPFYEDDVDKYFMMFEKVAISLGGKGVTSAWSPLGNFLEGQAHPNLSSNQVL